MLEMGRIAAREAETLNSCPRYALRAQTLKRRERDASPNSADRENRRKRERQYGVAIRGSGFRTLTTRSHNIWRFELVEAKDGQFEKVHNRLKRLLGTQKKESKVDEKQTQQKQETEAEMRERIEREVLEKHGLLKKEALQPAGGNQVILTRQQIASMSPAEYAELTKSGKKVVLRE